MTTTMPEGDDEDVQTRRLVLRDENGNRVVLKYGGSDDMGEPLYELTAEGLLTVADLSAIAYLARRRWKPGITAQEEATTMMDAARAFEKYTAKFADTDDEEFED